MAKKTKQTFRNRITEILTVKGGDVKPCPFNWKTHPDQQKQALHGILTEIGIAGIPACYRGNDGDLYILDGHCRLTEVAVDTEWQVAVLDITEDEARKLIAVYDPIAQMAEANPTMLAELLADLDYDSEYLNGLLADLAADNGVVLTGEDSGAPDLSSFFETSNAPENTNNTQPIVCPHCGKELPK